MAASPARPDTFEHLIAATTYMLARQERLAHAEYYFGKLTPESQAFAGRTADEARPWRGLMGPDMISIINILEEMGRYEGPDLKVPDRAV